jgi:hypothetical protein
MSKGTRTAAVEMFPYHDQDEDSNNYLSFVFDNRLIVSVDLGKEDRAHEPLVDCMHMDTGEIIVPPTRMTETALALLLGSMAVR